MIEAIVPRIDPAGFGYGVVAFCLVEIDQKVGHDEVATALADAVPEIVDMHTVTGASDMQLRLVARDATRLQEVLDRQRASLGQAEAFAGGKRARWHGHALLAKSGVERTVSVQADQ